MMALFYKLFISITVVVVGLKLDAAVWLLASGPLYLKAASVYQLYVVSQLIGSVYRNGTKYEATVAASRLEADERAAQLRAASSAFLLHVSFVSYDL